eukprot:6685064-Prymnesium_polylepis.1
MEATNASNGTNGTNKPVSNGSAHGSSSTDIRTPVPVPPSAVELVAVTCGSAVSSNSQTNGMISYRADGGSWEPLDNPGTTD